MTRRKRRERRSRHVNGDRVTHPAPRRAARPAAPRRDALEARHARLRRVRTYVGAAGFVPLVASLLCSSGWVVAFCLIPREVYLGLWAAIFGTFLGITVRMWRERRALARGAAS